MELVGGLIVIGHALLGILFFCGLLGRGIVLALAERADTIASMRTLAKDRQSRVRFRNVLLPPAALRLAGPGLERRRREGVGHAARQRPVVGAAAIERAGKAGAEAAGVEIPGGELAQVPELIRGHPSPWGFDLVASAFGTVELDGIVTGAACAPGDALIGLPSTGVHSNGLTLARSGDLPRGLKEIESAMRGIHDWLEYINRTRPFEAYWDPSREIRKAIEKDLDSISARDFNPEQLIADAEWLGKRMEEEIDYVRRDERRQFDRDFDRRRGVSLGIGIGF